MSKSKFATPVKGAIPISTSLPDLRTTGEQDKAVVTKRVFGLSVQAVFNAIIIGLIAKGLVALISLITNLSFYGEVSFEEQSPAGHSLGLLVIIVPVIGALIVGIMARFGSAAIRGHGIPEAMEQILVNQSKINPLITFLKPVSAAISIGTGGPFGAEGPIIATGGAFGSVAGQVMRINANERKIMLAAGATAGMSAIFGTPVAALMLAIELLLFEFSPRSIIPVALACVTGCVMHFTLFGTEPVFGMPDIPEPSSIAMVVYTFLGILLGAGAAMISRSIYWIEDMFEKLPIHWMWWPALGAIAVGVVGYFAPLTLGVGYENISYLLSGQVSLQIVLSLCLLKFISWAISLGSGTSGGTLAPLLTIGGALGALLGTVTLQLFPGSEVNMATCALIGMAAMFAGASRALLTSILFALETTMQPHSILPLLGACTASYFVSFFLMKGSIMTEKIQRRGVLTPESYEPDILQKLRVEQVMRTAPHLVHTDNTVKQVRDWIKQAEATESLTNGFIIADDRETLVGIVRRKDIFSKAYDDLTPIANLKCAQLHYIYPENRLSLAVDILDKQGIDILPVVDHEEHKVIGIVTHQEIFSAYTKRRHEEEVANPSISLKYRSARLIVKGKQLYKG